jgi:hypothetical protein
VLTTVVDQAAANFCNANLDSKMVRSLPGRLSALSVFHSYRFCMVLLYGRAGRLTAQNGGFRPGQCEAFQGIDDSSYFHTRVYCSWDGGAAAGQKCGGMPGPDSPGRVYH